MRPRMLFVAAVTCIATVGCLPALPPFQGEGPTVAVYGDSITYQAQRVSIVAEYDGLQRVTDDLVANGYSGAVSAMIGASTADLVVDGNSDGVLDVMPTEPVDMMVVALGTNDMHFDTPPADLDQRIDGAIANIETAFGYSDCDIAVTVREGSWGLDVTAPPYNARLREVADVVVEWAEIVEQHPEYVNASNPHLTEVGMVAYRDAILAGVEGCP